MLKGILGLLIMAVIGGSILRWLIFPTPNIICLPKLLKLLVLITCILGGLFGYLISNVSLFFINKSIENYGISYFSGIMWFIPIISVIGVIKPPLALGLITIKSIDQGWREYFGGQIIYYSLKKYSLYLQLIQNNNLKIYLLTFILWIIIAVAGLIFF